MKKLELFWAWFNYKLSYFTHHYKPYYRLQLWYKYQDIKLVNKPKIVSYTHSLNENELNGK